jgi:hypothetical protein
MHALQSMAWRRFEFGRFSASRPCSLAAGTSTVVPAVKVLTVVLLVPAAGSLSTVAAVKWLLITGQ